MSDRLPPLVGILRGDVSHFVAKMGEARAVAAETSTANAGAFNQLAGVGKIAMLASGAAMVGVAGVALELATRAADAGQAAFEMSEKFGLMPSQASAWIAAANAVGVSQDSITTGFKFLSRNMESAHQQFEATGKISALVAQPFKDLGVQLTDAHGKFRSMNDIMLAASDRFKAMPDGAEKAGLAMKLFGRSGSDLLPVLDEGKKGLTGLMAAARASGAVMSDQQVDAAHQAYLAHKQFDQAIAGVTNRLSVGLLPAMTQGFGFITNTAIPAVSSIVTWMGKHKDVVAMVAAAIGGPLVFAMGAYAVSATTAGIAQLPLIAGFIAMNAPIIAIVAAIALLSAGVVYAYNHWGWFRSAVNAAGGELKTFVGWLSTTVPPIWRGFTKDVSDAWNGLKAFGTWVSNTFGPILNGMGGALKTAGGFLNSINPWAKHSPSLVENVQSGTSAIVGHYGNMARSIGSAMSGVGGLPGFGSGGSFGAAVSSSRSSDSGTTDLRDRLDRIIELLSPTGANKVVLRVGDRDFEAYIQGTAAAGWTR